MEKTKDTQQLQALAHQLKESKARYHVLVEKQIEAMCRWLPNTSLTYVNEGYRTICGKKRTELIGHKWIEFVPEHSHEMILRYIQSLGNKSQATTFEHELITADDRTIWISVEYLPFIE